MRRVVIASADASREHVQRGGNRFDCVFVTLTYQHDKQYCSRDISGYIKRTREYLKTRNLNAFYQWVIELTKKGKPHYHVLWWVPKGTRLPKPDTHGMWDKGMSNIKLAYRPVGYVVKYATKGEGGDFPKGARLFGVGASVDEIKLARHRYGLPMWLFELTDASTRCTRVARVGWVEKGSGEIHQSPWIVDFARDAWGFITVEIRERVAHVTHDVH
jgi:hypothetical protein